MHLREMLRPLPLVLILLFGAVAVVDIVDTLRTVPAPPPSLFGGFLDQETGSQAIVTQAGVSVDPVAETVVFRATGSLEIPFTVDDRVDALHLRYRFNSKKGRAEIVISRPDGSGAGHDAEIRRQLSAAARTRGRVRIPLHGRRGEFVLRISAFLEARPARLNITTLRLIEEGDPTRRPRAENRRQPR
jgi:hypothetical protein